MSTAATTPSPTTLGRADESSRSGSTTTARSTCCSSRRRARRPRSATRIGARAHPAQADSPGAARVRRRNRQRRRAQPRAPRPASPAADGAVRGRRQGDQHGGHPPHAGRPPRPTRRASRHGRRADQHVLRRGAEPVPALTGQPGRRSSGGTSRWRATTSYDYHQQISGLEHILETGWQTTSSEERQPGVRHAVGARAVPQPTVRSRCTTSSRATSARRRSSTTTSCWPPSRTARAPTPSPRCAPCSRRSPARWRRTDGSSSCSRPATTRGWRSCGASGPTTNRSRPRATSSSRSSTASSTATTVRRRTRSTAMSDAPGAVHVPPARDAERGHQPAEHVDRAGGVERRRVRRPDRGRARRPR